MHIPYNDKVKKYFCKDYSIPVTVYQEPYFDKQLQFLNRQYNTIPLAAKLKDAVETLGGEEQFLSQSSLIREKMLKYLESKLPPVGSTLIKSLYWPITKGAIVSSSKTNIYKEENCNKNFISIDLNHANFSAYKMMVNHGVRFAAQWNPTYDDIISEYTDLEYFKKSKRIRQYVMGKLYSNSQQTLQKHIMSALLDCIPEQLYISAKRNADEIILEVENNECIPKLDIGCKRFFELKELNFSVSIEPFTLTPIKTKSGKTFFMKNLTDKKKLKCCPSFNVLETLRHYYKQEPQASDRVFVHEGRLCEYKDTLF